MKYSLNRGKLSVPTKNIYDDDSLRSSDSSESEDNCNIGKTPYARHK